MSKSNKVYLLKQYITNANISIGDYSYYYSSSGEQGAIEFQNKNVLYHFPQIHNDHLIIKNFCAIAEDVKFLMNGANHRTTAISTFPFEMFNDFENKNLLPNPSKGDTIIGNDVWIGFGATILPGIKIGDGAIIGAQAVVTKDVSAYTVVAGNPAVTVKKRFSDETITKLLKLQWWGKPLTEIKKLIPILTKTDADF